MVPCASGSVWVVLGTSGRVCTHTRWTCASCITCWNILHKRTPQQGKQELFSASQPSPRAFTIHVLSCFFQDEQAATPLKWTWHCWDGYRRRRLVSTWNRRDGRSTSGFLFLQARTDPCTGSTPRLPELAQVSVAISWFLSPLRNNSLGSWQKSVLTIK